MKEGKIGKALFFFKKAEAIKPNNPLHQNNVGTALALTGKMDEAVIYFRKAVALGQKKSRKAYKLHTCSYRSGKNQRGGWQNTKNL